MDKLELEAGNGIEDETESDKDTIPENELERLFSAKCEVMLNGALGKNKFILHMDGTHKNSPDFALGLSNHTVEVHGVHEGQTAKKTTLTLHGNVMGVKFSPENDNILYIATDKSMITCYDLRLGPKTVAKFIDKPSTDDNSCERALSCFDLSTNKQLLCAGTELFDGDAFLLFWDTRSPKLLGGYWESHTDDITSVKFHPNDMNKLMSSSTDGLINLYNLQENCEDDALLDSLNTESSVDKINWHCYNASTDYISCFTHTCDVKLWNLDEAMPFISLSRDELGQKMYRENSDFIYPISAHSLKNGDVFLLAGSNFNKGECARAILLDKKKKYKPIFNLPFLENQIIRATWFNANKNILATGSENGLLNLYKIQDAVC